MKRPQGGYRGNSWKELERIIALGHSRGQVFEDWLDLMLCVYLSACDNIRRGNRDADKFDGVYEARYLKILSRYASNRPEPDRPIDHFARAMAELILETEKAGRDCLGEIFMAEITYGEHGQYFTPDHLCDVMAAVALAEPIKTENGRRPTIADPSGCGSGRMLIASHKLRPDAIFTGIDLDPRCAKMCALNFYMLNIDGDVYCGNGLTGDMHTVWSVRGISIIERDIPKAPPPEPTVQLALL